MGESNVRQFVENMERREFGANQVIIREGDPGDNLYVVLEGSLRVEQQDSPGRVDMLGKNRVFGELALIYDCPRAATVSTVLPTVLWSLSSHKFRKLAAPLASRLMNENLNSRVEQLRRIGVFSGLTDSQLRRVAAVMQEERFEPGEVICQQGEQLVPGLNDKFYIIADGVVRATKEPLFAPFAAPAALMHTLSGASPRSLAAAHSNAREAHAAEAPAPAAAAALPASSLQSEHRPRGNEGLPERRRSSMDSLGSGSGTSTLVDLGTLGVGEWFGEMALLSDAPRSANIIALGNPDGDGNETVCYALSRGAFQQILSPSPASQEIENASEVRKEDNNEKVLRHQRDGAAASVQLDALEQVAVIGEGGFSIVKLAVDPAGGGVFALKIMNKNDLWKRSQTDHVRNERRILMQVSHPFIIALVRTFQDPSRLYMLMEFVQGGELFSRVLRSYVLRKEETRRGTSHVAFT